MKERLRQLRRRFIWSRVLQGLGAIAIILGLIALGDYMLDGPWSHFQLHLDGLQSRLLSKKYFFYSIYFFSEVSSLFPPEIFILALDKSTFWVYAWGVFVLSMFSYLAAICMYILGHFLGSMSWFHRFVYRFYKRELRQLKRFGALLVLLSALTPVPYAITCLLVGSSGLSPRSFMWYAAFRYLRFLVLGYLIWELSFSSTEG